MAPPSADVAVPQRRVIHLTLAGAQPEPVVHGNHFWFAWAAFSPGTTVWTAP